MNRNKMNNVHNKYQRPDKFKRVLCVCSAGLLRSPTMARIIQEQYGYNTRACGTAEDYALIVLDYYLIEWADEIVCADQATENYIERNFMTTGPIDIENLNIQDDFEYMDKHLVELIKERYRLTFPCNYGE